MPGTPGRRITPIGSYRSAGGTPNESVSRRGAMMPPNEPSGIRMGPSFR
jgi:hypothetical protein